MTNTGNDDIREILAQIAQNQLTVKTLKLMSKMKVMLSITIAFVLVHAILSPSGFEGISLNQSSYFE